MLHLASQSPRRRELLARFGLPFGVLGRTTDAGRLKVRGASVDLPVAELAKAFTQTLDW